MKRCPYCRAPNPSGSQACYNCKESIQDVEDSESESIADEATLALDPGFWRSYRRCHVLNLVLLASIVSITAFFWKHLPWETAVPYTRFSTTYGMTHGYWIRWPFIAFFAGVVGYGAALVSYGVGQRVADSDAVQQLPGGILTSVGVGYCMLIPLQFWIFLNSRNITPSPWLILVVGIMAASVYIWYVRREEIHEPDL